MGTKVVKGNEEMQVKHSGPHRTCSGPVVMTRVTSIVISHVSPGPWLCWWQEEA